MREEDLYLRVAGIVDATRGHVARTINTAMVQAYWRIGREIVLVEQAGAARAGYGEQLVERLAHRLTADYGRGFGIRTVWRARSFYLAFPNGSAATPILTTPLSESGVSLATTDAPVFPAVLGWSHYVVLLRVRRDDARQPILAARYQTYLPTEDELRVELSRQRDEAERALRLSAADDG